MVLDQLHMTHLPLSTWTVFILYSGNLCSGVVSGCSVFTAKRNWPVSRPVIDASYIIQQLRADHNCTCLPSCKKWYRWHFLHNVSLLITPRIFFFSFSFIFTAFGTLSWSIWDLVLISCAVVDFPRQIIANFVAFIYILEDWTGPRIVVWLWMGQHFGLD